MTYYVHFGLNGPPFDLFSSPSALFLGREHSEAMAALEWGIMHETSGYTLFLGEPGTGKTTLVCAILAKYFDRLRAAYLNHPKLSFNELMTTIMRQLGFEPDGPGKLAWLEAFDRLLLEAKPGARFAIIVDDAQALGSENFDELRFLSEHCCVKGRLIQIILVGQPELSQRLQSPRLKQIGDRIGARAVLNPLTAAETAKYIEHRLQLRQGRSTQIFTRTAINRVIRHSRGIPRRANILCHNAMLQAYAAGAKRVTPGAMKSAVADYEGICGSSAPRSSRSILGRAVKTGALVAGMGVTGVVAAVAWRQIPSLPIGFLSHVTDSDNGVHVRGSLIDPLANGPVDALADSARRTRETLAASGASTTAVQRAARPLLAAGSSPLPTPVTASVSAKLARSDPGHTIRITYGDTVGDIALRYYGTRAALSKIERANPQIDDIDRVYPGEVIYLPTPMRNPAGD